MHSRIHTSSLAEAMLPNETAFRIAVQIGLVILGTLVIALSSKVKVPMWPVAMSLQTLAIFAIAGLFGLRLAAATILAYLAEGLVGLPVFQGTPESGIGFAYMVGPTGGYLLGFAVMAVMTGWAVDRGYGRRPFMLVAVMTVAEVIMLALGAIWLGYLFGVDKAFAFGIGPFIITDLVKVALAASIVAFASNSFATVRRWSE